MNRERVAEMFKNKALELTRSLHAKFPAQLALPLIMLQTMDAQDALDGYVHNVHVPYAKRIADYDTTFFLTGDLGDLPKEVDSSMLTLVRSLWCDLDADDHTSVWAYFQIFERLAKAL